ncbi:TPA: hypothetical protein DEB00_01490 [Candidatus Uhrbacteria bacterium]|nr:hypothetical protein [Candidatus Uhrbacteria bacterium]
MEYNKLVRDRIPEIIKQNGEAAETYIADDVEFKERLIAKLHEEVQEFIEEPSGEEAADIIEVLRAYCEILGVRPEELEHIRANKAALRGGFSKKLILTRTNP